MSIIERLQPVLADDEFRREQLYQSHKNVAALHHQLAMNYGNPNILDAKAKAFHAKRAAAHEKHALRYKSTLGK